MARVVWRLLRHTAASAVFFMPPITLSRYFVDTAIKHVTSRHGVYFS